MAKLNDETIPQMMQLITAIDAEKKYKLTKQIGYPFLDFADGDEGEFQEIRFYKGDLTVDGIESTMERDWNYFSLIIDGNLTVTGDIDWSEFNNGSFIFVTGNVKVRNVILKGNVEMVVLGDLDAQNGILGNEGEDGGRLTVKGTTRSPIVLVMYYFIMDFAKLETEAYVDFEDEEDAAELLMAKFYEDETFDDSAIEDAFRAGKKILRKKKS